MATATFASEKLFVKNNNNAYIRKIEGANNACVG